MSGVYVIGKEINDDEEGGNGEDEESEKGGEWDEGAVDDDGGDGVVCGCGNFVQDCHWRWDELHGA